LNPVQFGSLAGGRVCSNLEHALPPARLLTPVHVNIPYKNRECNCLPEVEPVRFETCRRRQKLN
jgi:hypothetical protein